MSLEDAASWSRDRPVLLVLDWRGEADSTRWFQRFKNQEVPLYESALRARGATAAWCCRSDVRRRGWRDGLSGIGFPSRGQRTYYMIEDGNVVAWRTVRSNEFPASLQADTADAEASAPPVRDWDIKMEKRFITILAALIVSSEHRARRHRCHGVSSGSSTSSQGCGAAAGLQSKRTGIPSVGSTSGNRTDDGSSSRREIQVGTGRLTRCANRPSKQSASRQPRSRGSTRSSPRPCLASGAIGAGKSAAEAFAGDQVHPGPYPASGAGTARCGPAFAASAQ